MTTSKPLIPSRFFPDSVSTDSVSTDSESDSVKYNPTNKHQTSQSQKRTHHPSQPVGDETFCPIQTHLRGENFSKSNQVEYRIQIHPNRMVILQEQSILSIQTNIQISNMESFCMFLQTNREDTTFNNEFKLFTQGFISPYFRGNLIVKVKNIESFTKVLYPTDIIGYLTVQPFILKPEDIFPSIHLTENK